MLAGLRMVSSCWRFLAVVILFGTPALGWAQFQLGDFNLQKEYDRTSQRRNKLLSGEDLPTKADMDVAKASAEYFIYRFTHATEIPEKLHKDFNAMVASTLERKNNRAYIEGYLAPALVKSMKDLLQREVKSDRRAEYVHAGQTLPTMAKFTSKTKSDAIGEYLVELVKDKSTPDIVRLYALKALKETMPIAEQPEQQLQLDLKNVKQNEQRARDVLYVNTLRDFIEQPIDITGKSYEEYGPIYFLRREAIASLAQAGAPAVLAVPEKIGKKQAPDGPVATTLLKVLAGQLQPPPSLQEKIEAANGLCQMSYKNMPEYDPALATYLIGQTIEDYTKEYQKDFNNFARAGADKRLPIIAWRIESRRLKASLEVFVKNANTTAAAQVKASADPIFDAMGGAEYRLPPAGKVAELAQIVPKLRPANGKVFKTLPKAEEIKLP